MAGINRVPRRSRSVVGSARGRLYPSAVPRRPSIRRLKRKLIWRNFTIARRNVVK